MPTPTTDIDPRYGEPDATPTPWEATEQQLTGAEVYWLSTVRPDGRPHVTSLISVWRDGAAHICAGPHALTALAAAWEDKYGAEWHFDVLDGGFDGGGGLAHVYRIEPTTVFAFGKAPYSQTRYRFPEARP
jgi:hypothetical protein